MQSKKMAFAFMSLFLLISLLHSKLLLADWSAPATLSWGGDARNVRLAMDLSGNVFANWQLDLLDVQIIQSSMLSLGNPWSNPVAVSGPSSEIRGHELVSDWGGNVYAGWNVLSPGASFILGSGQQLRGSWSSSTMLQYGLSQTSLKMAARYYGRVIAVWAAASGKNSIIQAARYAGDWSLAATISDLSQNARNPAVAIDKDGKAIIVWENDDGINTVIQVSVCTPLVCKNPEALSYPKSIALSPQVSMNDAGHAMVVWKRWDGENWVIESSTLINEWWTKPIELSLPGQNADLARIGIDQNGQAMAVWKRFDGSNMVIEGSFCLLGSDWTKPISISASGQDADTPEVAVNERGQVVVIYSRSNGAKALVEARTATLEKSAIARSDFWSEPERLSSAEADGLNPRVVLSESGNAVVAWQYSTLGIITIQAAAGRGLFANDQN